MMRFAGRDTELATIMARWQRVADHDAPVAQVVLIRAERGIGKTRLALEVQRAIRSGMQDDDGYWPDVSARQAGGMGGGMGGGMDVNADPRACRFDRPIPFMWWGVRAADPGADNALAGNAISTYEPWLAPQLVALAVRARVLRTGKAIFDVWRDVAMGELASWTGYDTVMSIGEGLFRTVSIVRGTAQSRGAAAAQDAMHKRQTDRVEDILDELDSIFNPRALSFARTPGVIFIDDAQFMTRDPGLAAFTEALLRRAVAQSWPVLILVTHWRRELDLDLAREDPSFARILDAARHGDGAFLDASNLLDLDLQPLADLSEVLVDALPGLLPAQARALLDHAGGNPRHLEQIIAFLHENEDFFEDFDTSGPLTEDGLAAALEETHDLFKVVLRRLRDAPLEVQEAICIASLQGVRFVSGVVDDVMTAHLGKPPGGALAAAADPYSMVRPEAAGQIAAFAERLFHQVAERRRRSIKALADDAALHSALKSALAGRLDDPSFDTTADIQTRALTYGLAAQVFVDDADGQPRKLDALARLAHVEVGRGGHRAAVAAARTYLADLPTASTAVTSGLLKGHTVVADILLHDGDARAASRLLRPLALAVDDVCGGDHPDPSQERVFWMLATLGDAELALGQMEDAARWHGAALDLARSARGDLSGAQGLRAIGIALDRVATTQAARGAFEAAFDTASEAVTLARVASERDPGTATTRTLGIALDRFADFALETARFDAAAHAAAEAHDITKARHSTAPTAHTLDSLVISIMRLAQIARVRGQVAQALAQFEDAAAHARQLCMLSDTPRSAHVLAATLSQMAQHLVETGDPTSARPIYEDTLARATELDRRLQTPKTLADRASLHLALGALTLGDGDIDTAAQHFSEAEGITNRLKDWVGTADSLSMWAASLSHLAHLEAVRGDMAAARDLHDTALRHHRQAMHSAAGVDRRLALVQALQFRALFAEAEKDWNGAALAYREAAEITLGGLDPVSNAVHGKRLAMILTGLGNALSWLGDPAGAQAVFLENLQHARTAFGRAPEGGARAWLVSALEHLGSAFARDDPQRASHAFGEALEIYRGIHAREWTRESRFDVFKLVCLRAVLAAEADAVDDFTVAHAEAIALSADMPPDRIVRVEKALADLESHRERLS